MANYQIHLEIWKKFTAKQLIKAIEENPQESRKELFLNQFAYHGKTSGMKQEMQFWKHDKPSFFSLHQ